MRLIFAIPGDLATLTGGYGYDRKLIARLEARGVEVAHRQLSASFPFPGEADLGDAVAIINSDRNGAPVLIDGLAFGAMPREIVRAIGSPLIALIHHPLGLEAGLTAADSARLIETERAALAITDHVAVTSPATRATLLADFGVPPQKISVAEPGTDRASRATGSGGATMELLAVGAIVPRKGFDVLVSALSSLRSLDWRLRIVGSRARDLKASADLQALIDREGLSDRIELAGERNADELAGLYTATDVFCMSSHYEGYGMALAEAMARGLPIVTTTGGAAADTVPDDAAIKVPPGDIAAFRDGLRTMIVDRDARRRFSDASWRAGQALPSWDDAARIVADAVSRVMGSPA